MSTLYLTEAGVHVQKNRGRFLVCKGEAILCDMPVEKLDNLVLFGGIQVSSRAMTECLRLGIPLTWLSYTGEFFGRLESTRHVDIGKQRQQFRMGDKPDFCLTLAQAIINAKIANCLTVLRRYQRTADSDAAEEKIAHLRILVHRIPHTGDIAQLMGIEGAAARSYFAALADMVHDDFHFHGRNKQPPKDPFNSLLSFGYTLLLYDLYTAIVNTGLNPYAGLIHKDRQGHPALASDLMEEWRPIIVDSLVMSMVQRREIQPGDFLPPDEKGGVYLGRESAKTFIAAYEKRMARRNKYGDRELTFRQLLMWQVGRLIKAIMEEDAALYQPVRIR